MAGTHKRDLIMLYLFSYLGIRRTARAELESKLTAAKRSIDEQLAECNGKLAKTNNELAEAWNLINDDVINEIKLINQKLTEAKSELSEFKSEFSELKAQNRSLLSLSIFMTLLLLCVAVVFFHIDAANTTFDDIIARFNFCWFQRGCFQAFR